MYSILIADDEKLERNGIKSLISRFSYPLKIIEAKNGKEALEYLKDNSVDILFTDIKMPYMDGLELSKHARALKPGLKIIIFSAYGEFDYAKKAIGVNAIQYILKPIDLDEFQNVMSRVIKLCDDEMEAEKSKEIILQGYEKGLLYEKEKLLFQLLGMQQLDEDFIKKADSSGLFFKGDCIQMLLIDCSQRFFDTNINEFENVLNANLKCDLYILSMNERQSLVVLKTRQENKLAKQDLVGISGRLTDWISVKSGRSCFVVIGRAIYDIADISGEYNLMEQVLEYKFFIEESEVLCVEDYPVMDSGTSGNIDVIVDRIHKLIEIRDYQSIKSLTEELTENIKKNEGLSSIYIKHIFMEIIRRLFAADEKNSVTKFRSYMETIYTCSNIGDLKNILSSILEDINSDSSVNIDEANRKVIEKVLEVIEIEYANDLGVEYIADRVYLSPNYLGQLFKKHMGKSLTRYIMEFRMVRAREFLENTNMKVSEIGERTGFTNKSYFTLIFKNYFGITPAQYREKV